MADQVLVTGGSGFIGGWVVARALQAGYDVRASVRDLKRESEVRAAIATVAPEATSPERLSFVPLSLERDDGWAAATAGCRYVQHVASPIPLAQPKDPQELIRPAREGALRALRAAVEAGVERVVMTSSTAAVGSESGGSAVKTEADWTDPDNPDVNPYAKSKTIAERAARAFMAEHGGKTEFATVNPSLVLGPVMSGDFSPSVEVVTRLLTGKIPGTPRIGFNIVDVRDVADLHLLAMTSPGALMEGAAGGRYIGSSDFLWFAEVAAVLRERFGERARKVPTRKLPDLLVRGLALVDPGVRSIVGGLGKRRESSSARAQAELGWRPRSGSEAVIAAAESLFAHGVV